MLSEFSVSLPWNAWFRVYLGPIWKIIICYEWIARSNRVVTFVLSVNIISNAGVDDLPKDWLTVNSVSFTPNRNNWRHVFVCGTRCCCFFFIVADNFYLIILPSMDQLLFNWFHLCKSRQFCKLVNWQTNENWLIVALTWMEPNFR